MTPDIYIDGRGFYQIAAGTARGRRFMRKVEGAHDGMTYSDDTRLTREIADGAFAK